MTPLDGRTFARALSYALAVVPTDDDHADLQHVTFIADRVVGSDGKSRHDGFLFGHAGPTISVARLSAALLLHALEYAAKVSKSKPEGTFTVTVDGDVARIKYGARLPIEHDLALVDVGFHPPDPREWVPPDAALNPEGLGHIECGALKTAMSWWKSWDKDYGTSQIRGGHDGGPLRCDVTSNGRRVATAFLLPADHPPAEIREVLPMEAMWDSKKNLQRRGRSNLDLVLDYDGEPSDGPKVIEIEVGGEKHQLDVTGLEGWSDLLKEGPCDHRSEAVACLPCTEEAIKKAHVAKADATKPKKRRGKKDVPADAEGGFQPLAPDTTH